MCLKLTAKEALFLGIKLFGVKGKYTYRGRGEYGYFNSTGDNVRVDCLCGIFETYLKSDLDLELYDMPIQDAACLYINAKHNKNCFYKLKILTELTNYNARR